MFGDAAPANDWGLLAGAYPPRFAKGSTHGGNHEVRCPCSALKHFAGSAPANRSADGRGFTKDQGETLVWQI